jgi:hypothetical protein
MFVAGSEKRAYAAEALLLARDWDAARDQIEEALRFANAHGERVYLPQLFLMQAALARAGGESAAAHASARQALAEARAQEAPWLELIALMDLCESDGARAEDRQALALIDQLPSRRQLEAMARSLRDVISQRRLLTEKTYEQTNPNPDRCMQQPGPG